MAAINTEQAQARILAHQDCLHLDPETRQNASRRLKSAKGHLEGVLRMLEDENGYCVDVLKQI